MEQETKLCPYCGKEIKNTAKKCIHCGKWLEKKCPACGEWVKTEANKCRYCGEWLGEYEKWKYEKATGVKAAPETAASGLTVSKETMKEMLEEQKDEKNSGCLLQIECIVIVGLYAAYYDWGLWECAIGIAISEVLSFIRFTRVIMCVAFSVLWAVFAQAFFGSWIAAVIAFIVSIALHIPQFSKLKYND